MVVCLAQRGDLTISPRFRWAQLDEEDLVLLMMDDALQACLELDFLRRVEIALEDRILKVIPKILTDSKHLSQPLRVTNVVTDDEGVAHDVVIGISGASALLLGEKRTTWS